MKKRSTKKMKEHIRMIKSDDELNEEESKWIKNNKSIRETNEKMWIYFIFLICENDCH